MDDLLENARFALSDLGTHAASHAGNIVDLAIAHPIVSFQILIVASILINRRGSQI